MHVDMCRAEFRDYLRDPVAQFPLTLAEGLALPYAEQVEAVDLDRGLIWDPAPMVFGLDRNPDDTEPSVYPLALAIWKLLSQTSMATVRENRPGALLRDGPERPAARRHRGDRPPARGHRRAGPGRRARCAQAQRGEGPRHHHALRGRHDRQPVRRHHPRRAAGQLRQLRPGLGGSASCWPRSRRPRRRR